MSLDVPAEMVEQAEQGRINASDFVRVIKGSLPRAWAIVEKLVATRQQSDKTLVAYGSGPMDEETRGQLLRMLAGTAIRQAVERHFGVGLLFQNCHNVAVVKEGSQSSQEAQTFTSAESQVKNQKPEYQHC